MKKKLLDAAGRASIALAPQTRPKFPAPVVFDTPEVTRVCNASSKDPLVLPTWPSYRPSESDGIKAKGQPC